MESNLVQQALEIVLQHWMIPPRSGISLEILLSSTTELREEIVNNTYPNSHETQRIQLRDALIQQWPTFSLLEEPDDVSMYVGCIVYSMVTVRT